MSDLCSNRLAPLLSPGFSFGVATAAYQVEGAVRTDGRTDSIWDTFCRTPGTIHNGENGEVACDHYARWREDVELMHSMNIESYRFSVSWSRVIPDASGEINPAGIDFYKSLARELRSKGIRPMVTFYHWDLPQYLQDSGGWQNRETAYRFAEYSTAVAQALGDAVDFYITINEPWCAAILGHRSGIHAPGIRDAAVVPAVIHHLLLAHGLCVKALRDVAPHADVGIALNGGPSHPASGNAADRHAAIIAEAEQIEWFTHPLFTGSYGPTFDERMAPFVQEGDLEIVAEPCDYLGWNYYSRNVVEKNGNEGYLFVAAKGSSATALGWEIYPQGLRELLEKLVDRYDLPPIYITENGAVFEDRCDGEIVDDHERLDYIRLHLETIADLIADGFDIRGYLCWSLMDNFEWSHGYSARFGLVRVDYETQQRIVKNSGRAMAQFFEAKQQANDISKRRSTHAG
jgi:beta-glucosidase